MEEQIDKTLIELSVIAVADIKGTQVRACDLPIKEGWFIILRWSKP